MRIPLAQLPMIAPTRPDRPTQETVPPTRAQRQSIRELARQYIDATGCVPPMPMEELRVHADAILEANDIPAVFREYTAVILNNESWREQLAPVPYERRLLLLPKCLRDEEHCPAPFDEFGLLCKQCGMCSIQDLQEEAEKMGYAVLTAEGSAIVMAIIDTGKIDAIVGVSCLSVLEKAFPYMEAAAIPGVAIPLLQDDCKDTNVDIDDLWEIIHLNSDDQSRRLDLNTLRDDVRGWFTEDNAQQIMGDAATETEQIARDWLLRDGKRWRPFLTACVVQAMSMETPEAGIAGIDDSNQPSLDLLRVAFAVECFHKASLVHDDIQDEDDQRYGDPTVHAEHGVPLAINVGDYLIGEGYRLIAACSDEVSAAAKAAMLKAAAEGHRLLCLGQGAELSWAKQPTPLKSRQVLEIFRQKTAPAFGVALKLGAHFAGAGEDVVALLDEYADALGIAYQINDDLDDVTGSIDSNDSEAMRPSVVLAIAAEKAEGDDDTLMKQLWRHEKPYDVIRGDVDRILRDTESPQRCHEMLDLYKQQAVLSLRSLRHASLKGLLRRVMGKIFDDLEIQGWCSEHETTNASGREAGAQAAG